MKALVFPAAVLALGQALSTDYDRVTRLRIDATTEFSMETTSMKMERDGEPVQSPRGGGGASSSETRRVVQLDEFLKREEGRPTHVRRTFETIESKGSMEFGDRSVDLEREAPLEEVTLDIRVDEDGEVTVEVADGARPDDELLEGHRPDLALDALLPAGEVEEGDSWDLAGEAIVRALGFDVEAALFPQPEPPEGGFGEGRRGGGGRGGFGRGATGTPANLFRLGEWRGEATLESHSEEHEGSPCAAIAIEIECRGDLPEAGSGGGGRGFWAGPLASPAGENEFEIRAEGRLLYSLADRRPILLELEGKITYERHMERSGERGSFTMSSTHEGTFTQTVRVTAAETE